MLKVILLRPLRTVLERYMGQTMWAELCNQFDKTKAKSESCKRAREANKVNHSMGRTSIAEWVENYFEVFGVEASIPVVYDKVYLHLDPLDNHKDREDNESGEGVENNDTAHDVDDNVAEGLMHGVVAGETNDGVVAGETNDGVDRGETNEDDDDDTNDVTDIAADKLADGTVVALRGGTTYLEKLKISVDLHKAYNTAIKDGKSPGEANNHCRESVLGKGNTRLSNALVLSSIRRKCVRMQVTSNQEEVLKLKEQVRKQNIEVETLNKKLAFMEGVLTQNGMISSQPSNV